MKIRGISLIEVVVSILMVSVLLAAFGVIVSTVPVGQREEKKEIAYRLAQQQMDALKAAPFGSLANQTDGPFRFIGYPVGQVLVQSDAQAYSGGKVLQLSNASVVSPFSSLALLPSEKYADFTYSGQEKILNGAPSGWKQGLLVRYQDAKNYYWFYLDSGGLHFDKVISGTTTNLYNQSFTTSLNTWYGLKVSASASQIQLFLNNILVSTLADPDLSYGLLGAALTDKNPGQFDDLQVTGANSGSWNFDADQDNSLPAGWARSSISDLPSGSGLLTIADYNDPTIKKVTVRVTWVDRGLNQEVKLVTLITND